MNSRAETTNSSPPTVDVARRSVRQRTDRRKCAGRCGRAQTGACIRTTLVRRPRAALSTPGRAAGGSRTGHDMTRTHLYEFGLDKNEANFVALSPLSFIERTAGVYPEHTALLYGSRRQTWRETHARCRRLASALVQRGIGVGDTVAVMLPNVPAMFEAHFGVPMTGAVLNTLNTRLDAEAIAFMLQHGEAKALLTDREFSGVIEKALAMVGARRPFVIEV